MFTSWELRPEGGGEWIPAIVPGTVLGSYVEAGLVADPLFDTNVNDIDDAFFCQNFRYRAAFTADKSLGRVFLCFDAINWKADVYVNGAEAGSIAGAFARARFDITGLLTDGANALEVVVYANDTPGERTYQGLAEGPGPNGGLLGADNPTLHASVGWDWLPTIPGRNIGVYGAVTLETSGDIGVLDPWVETKLNLREVMALQTIPVSGGILKPTELALNEPLVVDFESLKTVGSVEINWGSVSGGAAAEFDVRYPAEFALETSLDGESWQNIDYFAGGDVEQQFFGIRTAEENIGTSVYEGHATGERLRGGTAILPTDLSFLGMGVVDIPVFAPSSARYLRIRVLKLRELNGMPVPCLLNSLHVYAESAQEVEQSVAHEFALDASAVKLTFRADVVNYSDAQKDVVIGAYVKQFGKPGEVQFSTSRRLQNGTLSLAPNEKRTVEITFLLENPELWWPNTYGEQPLYDLIYSVNGAEAGSVKFGVREFTYTLDGAQGSEILTLYCNGTRIICKGGNWGMDDALKTDTAAVFDAKVRLHAEANLTMIRNWIGMTNHPAFYEACDKYGILVWDDFWLANPVDGPEPNDEAMFLQNAADKIRKYRGHPSLALYCGRNEGNPPKSLDDGLRELCEKLDGTRYYFSNSAMTPVGSGGGYSLANPGSKGGIKQYFNDVTSPVIRSERGIPNVPNKESIEKFLKAENVWPISEPWAHHDWTYHMNGPANSYMAALQGYLGGDFAIPVDNVQGQNPKAGDPVFDAYKAAVYKMTKEAGKAWSFDDFCRAAQLINYDNHRGLFDALLVRRSNGLLMWMSQSSWPSFMWQTYDYYLDCNGGYYGVKSGCAPIKAVFDPRDCTIKLANVTRERKDLRVTAELFSLNGVSVSKKEYAAAYRLELDTVGETIGAVDFSLSDTDINFLQLITYANGAEVHRDTYWHNRAEYQNYRELYRLKPENITLTPTGDNTYTVKNNGTIPAAQIRLIPSALPAFISDNYFALMPGESRAVMSSCGLEL
ncbi:MAG: hypothetical protein LBM98_01675 [Oscillospiraceae bacterium]|nr:hypothetical protein [Oscillospiraceae bacterium]